VFESAGIWAPDQLLPPLPPFRRLPLPPLDEALGTRPTPGAFDVAIVAVYPIVGHDGGGAAAVVVHEALRGPAEFLGTAEARDVTAAV
jgi:hypothetical protein